MPRGKKADPANQSDREKAYMIARARRQLAFESKPTGTFDLASKVLRLLELRGMSQSSLSKVIDEHCKAGHAPARVHQTRLSKWLHRSGEPNHAQTASLAVALRVPLLYLADPARVEPPVLRDLEAEDELNRAIRRIGVATALDRIQLKATVEVVSSRPADPAATYAAERSRAVRKPG